MGDPAISVRQVGKTVVAIAPASLREGEDQVVAQRLRTVLLAALHERRRYSPGHTGAIADVLSASSPPRVIPYSDRIA